MTDTYHSSAVLHLMLSYGLNTCQIQSIKTIITTALSASEKLQGIT